MTKLLFFFSKNSHRYLDLEPSNLKVEFARDITIPNNFVVIYYNPLINAGARAMTMLLLFFISKSSITLTLSPAT